MFSEKHVESQGNRAGEDVTLILYPYCNVLFTQGQIRVNLSNHTFRTVVRQLAVPPLACCYRSIPITRFKLCIIWQKHNAKLKLINKAKYSYSK